MGGGLLRLSAPYRNGYFFRQQVTGYITPHVGLALGLGWGSSANLAPLATRDPREPDDKYAQPDPAKVGEFYQRTDQMTDVSVVLLPVLTRRHQVKLQLGVSVYRQRETGVDTLIYPEPRFPNYNIVPRQTTTARLAPVLGVGYDVRLSNRWAVGLNGTAYFTGKNAGTSTRPITTVGVRGTYRFSLRADSLGFAPIQWNEATWGVRAAGSAVASNGRADSPYRLRFNGGVWTEIPLSLTWTMRGEVNYAQRGYRIRELRRTGYRVLPGSGNANYLELPLLFSHEVAYRWRVYGGPYLAVYLNGYTESDGVRNPPARSHTVSGLMLGTTYALSNRFAADLRYQRDLVNLSSTPYSDVYHSFQLGLNYTIGKKP